MIEFMPMSGTLGTQHFTAIHMALKSKDFVIGQKLVQAAFDDISITEPELAQICDLIFYTQSNPLFSFLLEFTKRFPQSLYATKTQIATLLASAPEQTGTASELAREHLRNLRDRGALSRLKDAVPLLDGASRGFLVLTACYTLAGARSYSLRVLEAAVRAMPWAKEQVGAFEREAETLRKELAEPAHAELNTKWEDFFSGGRHAAELTRHCRTAKLDNLARRVELLSDNFRYSIEFKVDENEMYLLVLTGKAKDDPDGQLVQFLR